MQKERLLKRNQKVTDFRNHSAQGQNKSAERGVGVGRWVWVGVGVGGGGGRGRVGWGSVEVGANKR